MKEDDNESSSVWSKYVAAKQTALGLDRKNETTDPLTLEELEAAIAEAAASSGIPEIGMPPRSEVHPVKRSQLSKYFYLVLVLMFSSLIIGLIWWGSSEQIK